MNNNMYLYFDSNGYLKEFITCPARAGSENVNSIYFYVEPALESDRNKVDGNGDAYYALPNNVHHGILDFKLPEVISGVTDADGNLLIPLTFTSSNYVITDIQPFDKKRDLLFFKWFQKYQFVKVDLTANILLNSGNVLCTIGCYNSANTKVYNLDLFSFYVADNAVLQAVYITTSQYHELLTMFDEAKSMFDIEKRIVVLDDISIPNVIDNYENDQLIYDKATALYYVVNSSSEDGYVLANNNGLLGNKGALARYEVNGTSEVRQLYTIIGDRLVCLKTNNHDYLIQMSSNSVILVYDVIAECIYFYASANESAITLNQVISDTYKQIIATEGYVNSQDALLQAAIDNLRNYVDTQDNSLKTYVDTQDNSLKTYVDTQDNSLKTYVDTQDAKKLDKVTNSYPYQRLYGVSTSGVQQMYPFSSSAIAYQVVQRKYDANITVPLAPSTVDDATSKSYVDSKFSALGSALIYMGSKTVAQLNALTNIKTGDFYNVSSNGTLTQGNVKVNEGDNVAWDGSKWDKLSSDIDLSAYYNKTETDALLDEKQDLLVSGSNIKTINNQSILGSGNIAIQGTDGDYLEVISINVPSTLADFYTAYNSKPKIILTNIGYCSISVDTNGQDYFFEIECLYNSKRWALSWLAGDSGISGSTTINSIVNGTTYRKDYLTEENGLTKVEAFTILSQKFDFTIHTSAWTSISSGVFNAQATITLTNTYLDDDTNVEAFFENVVDSAGVVLASATQSGSDLVLVFYANESKTNAIGGFIKYVY